MSKRANLIFPLERIQSGYMGIVFFCLAAMLFCGKAQAQPVGEVFTVGSTAWDVHNSGSIGRMITFNYDTLFFSWSCLNPDFPLLGINLNARFPSGSWLADSSGVRITSPSYRARIVDMALIDTIPGGPKMPIVSYKVSFTPLVDVTRFAFGDTVHTYLANGAFFDLPHISVDFERHVHLLLLDMANVGGPWYILYQRSMDHGASFGALEMVDSIFTTSHLIVSSEHSPRSAVLYAMPRTYDYLEADYFNNDLVLFRSSDGTDWDWSQKLNLTQFTDADTFRMGFDVGAIFDIHDDLHVVFSTIGYFQAIPHDSGRVLINALIWHWSEASDTFTVVANGWNDSKPGAWHHSIDRGSLAYDVASGFLYCVYERFSRDDTSAEEFSNGEVWATVSTDNGVNWSEGINITNTPSTGCLAGSCFSEVFPSAAEVANDTLHVFYCLDKAAGGAANIWPEGTLTLNPMIYQKVACDLIPTTPLIPQDVPLHVGPDKAHEGAQEMVHNLRIQRIWPNPFNSSATIVFALPRDGDVSVRIFDIRGRLIRDLSEGFLTAGTHQVIWNGRGQDGKEVVTGVYYLTMRTTGANIVGKMLLMK